MDADVLSASFFLGMAVPPVTWWPREVAPDFERRLLRRGDKIEDFHSPILHAVTEYWLWKRGTRAMPSWADIDATEIPRLLPNLLVLGVEYNPLRFLFRLAGAQIIEFRGKVTGYHVDNVPWNKPETRASVQQSYALVIERRAPLFAEIEIRTRGGAHRHIYGGIWPLSDGPDAPIDRCIAAGDYGDLTRADLR